MRASLWEQDRAATAYEPAPALQSPQGSLGTVVKELPLELQQCFGWKQA